MEKACTSMPSHASPLFAVRAGTFEKRAGLLKPLMHSK
jgi:hypothetical protein